jgi:3-hydroxybutyryl-CoA dehydrogenase
MPPRTDIRRESVLSNKRVVIVGGGTMGADIAAIFAAGGMSVDLVQRPGKTRDSLQARVTRSLRELNATKMDVAMHDALGDVPWLQAGIVVESVMEDLPLKRKIFAELDRLAPAGIPLTSNSSSFPISQIGSGLKGNNRMLGLHFFMPAHLVPLVEVVRSDVANSDVAQAVFELMRRLHRKPVMVAKDIPGFLANRMQHALMREAWSLIDRGIATPEDVDIAVRYGFGFRYVAAGPILQKEMSGLDVNFLASSTVFPDLCNDSKPAAALAAKVKAGQMGMKSGKGFYDWPADRIEAEKARYQTALKRGLEILEAEDDSE